MLLRLRPNEHKLSLGIIDHEFVIDHPATGVTEACFNCCNGSVLIRIVVWIECQIDTGIIGITVRRWQVLANDRSTPFPCASDRVASLSLSTRQTLAF